jgi:hypothetical protein
MSGARQLSDLGIRIGIAVNTRPVDPRLKVRPSEQQPSQRPPCRVSVLRHDVHMMTMILMMRMTK